MDAHLLRKYLRFTHVHWLTTTMKCSEDVRLLRYHLLRQEHISMIGEFRIQEQSAQQLPAGIPICSMVQAGHTRVRPQSIQPIMLKGQYLYMHISIKD